jgi:hypothetical protein
MPFSFKVQAFFTSVQAGSEWALEAGVVMAIWVIIFWFSFF